MLENIQNEKRGQKAKDLTPPEASWWSTFFNGIGNGVMIGLFPLAILEPLGNIKKGFFSEATKSKIAKFNLAALTVGTILGALWGARDANRVAEYRKLSGDKITDLENENAQQKKELEALKAHVNDIQAHVQPPMGEARMGSSFQASYEGEGRAHLKNHASQHASKEEAFASREKTGYTKHESHPDWESRAAASKQEATEAQFIA